MHRLLGRVLRERDQEAGCWLETVEEALGAVEPLLFPEEQALSQCAEGTGLAVQIEEPGHQRVVPSEMDGSQLLAFRHQLSGRINPLSSQLTQWPLLDRKDGERTMSGSWAQAQISVVLTMPLAARALAVAERPSPVPQLPPAEETRDVRR